jgi:hypothetical protein
MIAMQQCCMFPNASDVLTNNVVMLSVQQVAGCFNKAHDGSAGGPLSHKEQTGVPEEEGSVVARMLTSRRRTDVPRQQGYLCSFVIFSTKGDIGLCHRVPCNIPRRQSL